MSVAKETYCAGCVTKRTGASPCSHCAWDESQNPEGHAQLPRHFVLMDRYYIGRLLGQGGFGITYLANDMRLNRAVAIKEYFPTDQCSRLLNRVTVRSYDGDKGDQYQYGLKRFLEEGETLAKFEDHPGIVPISDVLQENGTAYLVMSYQEGMDLKGYLASHGGKLSYANTFKLMMPVMDALREVHAHGILHRDVSPDNIFLTRTGHVKLLDFGAARQAIGEQSQSLSVILKQGYAPEEQYRTRGSQGPWTDVYAVAATFYRCMAGEPPPSALDRLSEDEMAWPSAHCPDLPPEKEQVLLKGLSVRAKDRFQTIQAFQQALLDRQAPPPPPPPPPQQEAQVPPPSVYVEDAVPADAIALYSVRSIFGASLLGSPFAGLILLNLNYRRLGRTADGWKTLVFGFSAVIAINLIVFAIPGFPKALSFVFAAAMNVLANKLQGPAIADHVARGGKLKSGWLAFAVGLICLTVLIGVIALGS